MKIIRNFRITAMVCVVVSASVATAQQCSTSITACGCTITAPGIYNVEADLNATEGLTLRGGCIDVSAGRVRLVAAGHAITGSGSGNGVGIHVLQSAKDVFIEGFGGNFQTAGYGVISGWKYGLESEGTAVVLDRFTSNGNTTGVLLNGAQNNTVTLFNASFNSVYGVWIRGGFANQVISVDSVFNGIAGVYIGCSSTGPSGRACDEDEAKGNGNSIYDSSFIGFGNYGNYGTASGYGIAVERGGKRNTIVGNPVAYDSVYDLFDDNPSCDSNLWQFNASLTTEFFYPYPTVNQSCIQ